MIRFILMNFPLCMFILALLIALFRSFALKRTKFFFREFSLYLFLLPVGLVGIWAFVYHAFFPEIAAGSIGWRPSPFEYEVASANLGVGVAGIVAFFRKNLQFCLAVLIVFTCFWWGAVYTHIHEIIVARDWAANNAGIMLWTDILIPLILIGSMIAWNKKTS